MLPKIIAQLVDSIPADMRPYAAEASVRDVVGAGGNMLIVNYAYAMMDPAFGWKYATAFAKATKPLPAVVTESAIQEAHDYLISGKCSDNLLGALTLREAPMKLARGLLEALLLVAPAMPLERIGELCCLPVAMIEKYEALFFSVRDRADDLCYRAAIAYPKTRQVEFQKDYLATVDPCDLLKRAAVRGGVDVVMELMGALTSRSILTDKELARILGTNILAEAVWLAEAGMIHQPLRIFDLALRLINSSERAAARAQMTGCKQSNTAGENATGNTNVTSTAENIKAGVTNAWEKTKEVTTNAMADVKEGTTKAGKIRGFHHDLDKAVEIQVDRVIQDVSAAEFDAVHLPGGTVNADKLRMVPEVQAFLCAMQAAGKPISAICHAPWELISAGLVRGRTLTSCHTIQDDIRNAGGNWLDQEVVEDRNWVTSRNPRDLPAFNLAIIGLFSRNRSAIHH